MIHQNLNLYHSPRDRRNHPFGDPSYPPRHTLPPFSSLPSSASFYLSLSASPPLYALFLVFFLLPILVPILLHFLLLLFLLFLLPPSSFSFFLLFLLFFSPVFSPVFSLL
ncbi:hypothetical protein N7462_003887 [Penicillium macrosclerotiorum]|uniref:uncharacterized protein n=1 Tax=Penicillium macrosclerotiorum TaxID=303699 RepID=UPI0025477292|nr:uncharacterized protein N7462_003887 [Penicillium macrosclerotiorum]KAJ5689495.1 hypothetical protein N7462_003887 [Penicillium macrosclerotiorum]